MRKSLKTAIVVPAVVLMCGTLVGAAPAFADGTGGDTRPLVYGQTVVDPVSPNSACITGGVQFVTTNGGSVKLKFAGAPPFKDGPGGTMTVTKEYSGTASLSVTASAEVDVSDVLASAKLTVSGTIEQSNETSATNAYTHPITPKKYGNTEYVSYGYIVKWETS